MPLYAPIRTHSKGTNLVQQTKPEKFLGKKQLGNVLHRIRTQMEQLAAIDNSSHVSIVMDMLVPLVTYYLLLILLPLHHLPMSRRHVSSATTTTLFSTTSLPQEVTSLSSVVLPLIDSEPTVSGNYNCVLPWDTLIGSLLLN